MVPGLAEKGSALANRIAFYASTIRAKTPDGKNIPIEAIDTMLKSASTELVIQAILNLSKQKAIGK